jgi:hypothetical protein
MDRRLELSLRYARKRISSNEAIGGWVGGSLTAGLGNPRSDVDVFLLHDGAVDPPVEQVIDDGVRIDIEFRRMSDMERLLDDLAVLSDDPRDGLDKVPSLGRLDDAARLFYAIPADEGAGARLLSAVRQREDVLRRSRILRAASICSSKSEDVQGAVEAGDPRQQLEISGRLLLEALEAYTAGCGQYYVGHKWGFAKLRATPHHEALSDSLDGVFHDVPLSAATAVSMRRVALAQQLLAAAFALGWEHPGAAGWAACAGGSTSPAWRPDPQWVPVRYGDTVLLEGLDKTIHVRLSATGLLLWSLAAALPAPDACRALAVLAPSVSESTPPDEEIAAYLDTLCRQGLLLPV